MIRLAHPRVCAGTGTVRTERRWRGTIGATGAALDAGAISAQNSRYDASLLLIATGRRSGRLAGEAHDTGRGQ